MEWNHEGTDVTITQKTNYPETETTALSIGVPHKVTFGLKLRVPEWANGATLTVNGRSVSVSAPPNSWASLRREWSNEDVVEFRLPMQLRTIPIDKQHPNRVAFAYGPVVLVQEQRPTFKFPAGDPQSNFKPADEPLRFVGLGSRPPVLQPFYSVGYATPYAIYFDT